MNSNTEDFQTRVVSADRERIVLGTEDGLFVVEVTRDGETVYWVKSFTNTCVLCEYVLGFTMKHEGSTQLQSAV